MSAPAVVAAVLLAREAVAEPSAADRTAARTLFQDARELVKSGRAAEACPKLEESQHLDPGIGTLFNLAECYAQIGRAASAWSTYLDVAEAAKRASQRDREAVARARADAIASKLARVVVNVGETAPHERVSFDGRDLSAASYGVAFPVDPGSHELLASAPGRKPWSASVSVAPQEQAQIVVPALDDAPVEVEPREVPATVKPAPAPIVTSSHGWQTTLAYALGGAAVVGLGTGAFFGLHAKSEWNNAEPACAGGHCTAGAYDEWSSARSSATASTISFGAAAVLAGAAIVIFLSRPAEQ